MNRKVLKQMTIDELDDSILFVLNWTTFFCPSVGIKREGDVRVCLTCGFTKSLASENNGRIQNEYHTPRDQIFRFSTNSETIFDLLQIIDKSWHVENKQNLLQELNQDDIQLNLNAPLSSLADLFKPRTIIEAILISTRND